MGLRKPKKGAVEWAALDEITHNKAYEGAEVGLRHVGGKEARRWQIRAHVIRQQESQWLDDIRKDRTEERCPELWAADVITEQGITAWAELIDDALTSCISGIKGVENCDTEEDAHEFIECLGINEQILIFWRALTAQALRPTQVFVEGPRDVAA